MRQKRFLKSVIDIREGEWGITTILFFDIFLLLFTYYLLKPARDALFLVELGPEQLPFVFILIAIIMIPVTALYLKASIRFRLHKHIIYTLFALITHLFILRWLMTFQHTWVPYIFYVWVSVFGALTASQFWLFANTVYNAVQAKRLFSIIGLGAILGSLCGGEFTSFLSSRYNFQPENLLMLSVPVLLLNIIATYAAWSLKKREITAGYGNIKRLSGKAVSFRQTLNTIKGSRHLLYIVGIVAIAMIVSSLVDFQFKAISTLSFQDTLTGEIDKVGLTGFLGTFYGKLSLVSVIMQIFIAGWVLRVLGVGGISLLLPAGLLLGTAGLLASVSLTWVVLLRGTDGALRNSVDKTGRELLFLPLSIDIKNQTKVFIDMFIDRLARGFAGVLLIALLYFFNFEAEPRHAVKSIGLIVLGLLSAWTVICILAKREYINSFRTAILNREIEHSEIRLRINDSSTIKTLITGLNSKNEKEIEYALDILGTVRNKGLNESLAKLLNHPRTQIRKKAVSLLVQQNDRSLKDEMKELLEDKDIDIRCDAVYYLYSEKGADDESILRDFLDNADQNTRLTVLLTIAKYGDKSHKKLVTKEDIERLLNEPSDNAPYVREQVIRIIGRLGNESFKPYLHKYARNAETDLSLQAIRAIGRLRDRELIPWLVEKLRDKRSRPTVTDVLAGFGEEIIPVLSEYMSDPGKNMSVRKFVPRIIAEIPSQKSIDCLVGSLNKIDSYLKYFIIKALNRLHNHHPQLIFDRKKIDDAIITEIRKYYEFYLIRNNLENEESEGEKLLIKALNEKLGSVIERIFRLMGLIYPSRDIYSAYTRITGDNKILRANAMEFLDNLLGNKIKRSLLPILDEPSAEEILTMGEASFNIRRFASEESLLQLMRSNDQWLRALAVHNMGADASPELINEAKAMTSDRDPLVRETVAYKIKQFS